MHDNAPSHISKLTREFSKHKSCTGEKIMEWPPSNPDLNPIENLWSAVKKLYKGSKQYNSKVCFAIILFATFAALLIAIFAFILLAIFAFILLAIFAVILLATSAAILFATFAVIWFAIFAVILLSTFGVILFATFGVILFATNAKLLKLPCPKLNLIRFF